MSGRRIGLLAVSVFRFGPSGFQNARLNCRPAARWQTRDGGTGALSDQAISFPLFVIPAKEDVKESDFSDFVEPD